MTNAKGSSQLRLGRNIKGIKFVGVPLALSVIMLTASGCSGLRPGNVRAVAPVSDAPRVGNAYLLRGFIGIFSTGIDHLGSEIKKSGVNAMVFQDDQWSTLAAVIRKKFSSAPNSEPLVLIGHSYGADDVVRIARELKRDDITVDLLVTLDPVTPPTIPSNVKRCVNIYQSNGVWDTLPWLRGVPVEASKYGKTELANYNIRVDRTDLLDPGVDHFNIEKKQKIHQEVIKYVLTACPPRTEWATRVESRGAPPAHPDLSKADAIQPDAIEAAAQQPPMLSTFGSPSVASGQRN